jgi:Fe-S oxidoreductase
MESIARASMELVRGFGGTVSSEHGDGLARSWLNRDLLGDDLYRANCELKAIFDPNGRLNPGNVVEAPSMKRDLRLGPDYDPLPILTEFDWSAEGSFADAVEMCNGNGACRKLESDVMCPSYMVTREEEHTTRGRANALRMAMSGALGPDALTSERMYEVMDLCVACKGCKTECPSNVDMGKMKTEWLGTYYAEHGVSARTRFFASAPTIARLTKGARARLVNWVNRQPAARKLMEKTLGIDATRALPPFAPVPFTDWFARQTWRADGPPVVLYADTFTNHNHPEIGQAAALFLHRAGYAVQVTTPDACCGRPLLSKGLVADAKKLAASSIGKLMPYVEAGTPIVGLEPSCILTFRDEWKSMLPGDDRVERLARQSMLFEDFVATEAQAGRLAHVEWKPLGEVDQVLVHGHCHQKALAGVDGTLAALALPGYRVELVDSSCCGMAGSFGYEVEHQQVSRAMAERRLLPAVRQASEKTLIAAPGTSCRAQISDLSDAAPLHPAQILAGALA